MNKIKITERVDDFSVYDLDGPIERTIRILNQVITKCPDYSNLRINVQTLDDTVRLDIQGDRLETDQEFLKRMRSIEKAKAREKAERERIQEQQHKLYLSLKKKFEKS